MDQDREQALTLELLEAIGEREDVTQRHLAERLGVALGLANSYLKRCVRKGYVKVRQAPANRYLYYLTPKGFAEKSRLTAEFFSASFDFYRRASRSYSALLAAEARRGARRVLLVGASELAEIAYLRAREHGLEVVGVYDPGCRKAEFLGVPVYHATPADSVWDAVVVTTFAPDDPVIQSARAEVATSEPLWPDFLSPPAVRSSPMRSSEDGTNRNDADEQ